MLERLRVPPMNKPRSDRTLGTVFAVCSLPVMLLLAVHAVVMARSQGLYYAAKYGSLRDDDLSALTSLAAARNLNAVNYNACEHAARRAWYLAGRSTGTNQTLLHEQARLWCDRALMLNPYQRSMRWMQAQQIARENKQQGLAAWQAYVEWEFWQPENHLILVDMALSAGRLDVAELALPWAAGASGYDAMAARVKVERERAIKPHAENGVGNGVRTRNIQNHNLALYQLSYTHREKCIL